MSETNTKNVFKRPSRKDSVADLIKFQNDFLSEKSKNAIFQPAAKVVRVSNAAPKISEFAKKRGMKPQVQDMSKCKLILGDVIEKLDQPSNVKSDEVVVTTQAFPKATRIVRSKLNNYVGTKSLFAALHDIDSTPTPVAETNSNSFGDGSLILKGNDAQSIHNENVELLSSLNPSEILAERKELLDTIDPALLRFIQSKRNSSNVNTTTVDIKEQKPAMDTDTSSIELLSHPNIHNWPHFDTIETDKMEWMKNISNNLPKLKPGQSYEARFDWKGVLLPYFSPETDSDRELFLHESDAQRPGYTLQELFRLARSNVIQQRNSAIGAISGILNIFHQGFYDKILEVPVSKIFFLLRFAFDDNTTLLLETTSKALATLFYHDSDEILLDCTHECSVNFREPTLGFVNAEKNLNEEFAKINLQEQQTFHNTFNDEEDKSTLNDFHLAETNLIECLLRTNILQRIRYILLIARPDNSTVNNCLKILIRLARTNKETAEKIFQDEDLLRNCIEVFLPYASNCSTKTQFYQRPQYLFLKLLRIIATYELPVWTLGIEDILKEYIHSKSDISYDGIKLQIEAFRLTKLICLLKVNTDLFSELLPAFHYLLRWHYNFLEFNQVNFHSIIRQHAAALIALIGCKPFTCSHTACPDLLKQCISKWFYCATNHGIQDFSQIILLSTCLVALSRLKGYDYSDFLKQYLSQFLASGCFKQICSDLCQTSPILATASERMNKFESLPDLNSIHFVNDSPQLIVCEKYPIYILNGIVTILLSVENTANEKIFNDLLTSCMNDSLVDYMKQLSCGFNSNVRKNWFIRNELSFIVNLLRFKSILKVVDKTTVQNIAFNVMRCSTENELEDLLFLLKNVVFNLAMYDNVMDVFQTDMEHWFRSYLLLLGPILKQTNSLKHTIQSELLISGDWFWLPLLIFLNNDERTEGNTLANHSYIKNLQEKDIIQTTLRLTNLQKRNSLNFITPTEELMFLMISFMGPDSTFLEPDISELLNACVKNFFTTHKDTFFTFDEQFEGKSKFENLYVLFLDHFQGTSYGSETFSSLVMIPLAQKYDVKWRKMVWSEHAVVLRFISCSEDQCIGSLMDYLYPIENDRSLLKCYYQAINGILRETSIPYTIAKHHLQYNQIVTKKT